MADINLREINSDWTLALMSKGVVVKIKIGRWRGTASLKSHDLGLKHASDESHDFMKKYITLGTQKLLPPEVDSELVQIEKRSRDLLKEYSFDTIWGRFIPNLAFDTWYNYNNVIKNDYIQASIVLGNRYDEIIAKIRSDYRLLAKDVWGRLYPNTTSQPTESFMVDFVDKIIAKIPPMQDIVASFKYDVSYFTIPLPSMIERDIASANDIRREDDRKVFETQLDRNVKTRIANEYVVKKTEIIDGFLNSTVVELRQNITELCDSVLIGMGKSNKSNEIGNSQLKKLKDMIKKVKLLNFANDNKVNELLNGLDSEISKFKGERNSSIIKEKLSEIVKLGSETIDTKDFNPSVDYLEL